MSNGNEIAPVTPFPLAMVLCDYIYRDPFTGKYTLIGTFSTIAGSAYPLLHPHMFVYVTFTGGRGKYPVRLELTDPDDRSMADIPGEVDSKNDPRVIHELGILLTGVTFPKPGEYRLSFYANDEFLVERRILVFEPPMETQT